MRNALSIALASALIVAAAPPLAAHCQIPCGIYGDGLRLQMLEEDVTTIAKAIATIDDLADKDGALAANQLVRWVEVKDHHADLVAEVVTEYFLRQRVKAPRADDAAAEARYVEQLKVLHALLVTSMKAKQTVDPEVAARLAALVERFAELYFGKEQLEHLRERAQP